MCEAHRTLDRCSLRFYTHLLCTNHTIRICSRSFHSCIRSIWNWSDYTGMSRRARVNAAFCLSRSNCHTISWMHVVAFVRFGLPNISTFWADDHYWRAKWALIVTASAINSNNNEDGGQTTINLRVSKRHWQAVGMPIWEVTKKNICVDSH